jgi:hypothetical protein
MEVVEIGIKKAVVAAFFAACLELDMSAHAAYLQAARTEALENLKQKKLQAKARDLASGTAAYEASVLLSHQSNPLLTEAQKQLGLAPSNSAAERATSKATAEPPAKFLWQSELSQLQRLMKGRYSEAQCRTALIRASGDIFAAVDLL